MDRTTAKVECLERLPLMVSGPVLRVLRPGASPFLAQHRAQKAIFIHVPKAAGTSITQALYGRRDLGHRPLAEFYAYDRKAAEAYFKFAIVRNPWDRLLSAYSYLKQGVGTTPPDDRFAARVLKDFETFESFVLALDTGKTRARVMPYIHFRSQVSWLSLPGETAPRVDAIGRLESLADFIEDLKVRLNLPDLSVGQERASARSDYREAYTPAMADIAAKLYAADIDAFGYSFD